MVDKSAPLLVIDLQIGFMINGAEQLIAPIVELINGWTGPVYLLRYRNYPGSMYTRFLNWSDFITSDRFALVPEIAATGKDVFDHLGYGPPPELLQILKAYAAVYICGVDTDACVLAHVFALWDTEIRPFVLGHYCASSDGLHVHQAALDVMLRQFGTDSVLSGPAA